MYVRTDVTPWRTQDSFRYLKPNVSFPAGISDAALAEHSIFPVTMTVAHDPLREKLVPIPPAQVGDVYVGVEAVTLTLGEVRAAALARLELNFAAKFAAGFVYAGNRYDIDATAQQRMGIIQGQLTRGITNPHGGRWRTFDDQKVMMDDAACQAFLDAALSFGLGIIHRRQDADESIKASNAINTVLAVDISLDDPA